MVTINLKENHRIRLDDRQWIFEKKMDKQSKEGKDVYKTIGYYSSIENCVKASYQYFIRKSDAAGVVDLMKTARKLLDDYTSILAPKFEIKEIK